MIQVDAEPILETPRLLLEPLVVEHAALVFEDLRDPALYTFIPREPPASLAALQARYRRLAARSSPDGRERWLNWVARLRTSGEPAGLFEATVDPDGHAHVAYTVFTRFWRRGLGREGTGRMVEHVLADGSIDVVVAELDTLNRASARLVESLGFERVALVPGADTFKGRSVDEYRYELRRRSPFRAR